MATTQHRPHGAFAGPSFGTLEGKTEDTGPTANPITQHRPHGAFAGQRYGTLSGKGSATVPTITSVTAVSGTELSVAWTGTATEYRLNGGTATALPDGTSPDTISGLTPNTFYTVELRDGAGAWSTGVGEWTDNTGGGGGVEAHDTVSAVLAGAGATVAGTAARVRIHAGTGALAGAGATVAGVAELVPQAGVHGSSGELAGAGAAVVGTATVLHIHAATGVLVGAGAEVVGAASIRLIHEATGVLAGAGAQIVALAARPSANSAPPSGHGPRPGRRGAVLSVGRRSNLSTSTR